MRRGALMLGLGLLGAMVPGRVRAAPPDLAQKRVRVHLDTNVVGWARYSSWSDSASVPDSHTDVVGFGLGRASQRGLTPYVVGGSQLIGLGAMGVINRWVGVGARTGISFDNLNYDNTADGVRTLGGLLVPYVHVMLRNRAIVVPFVEARGGFGGARQTDPDTIGPDGANVSETRSILYPTIGGGGGLHLFIAELVSLDLALGLDHRWVFQKIETNGNASTDYQKSYRQLELGLEGGLSLWF